jgi:hypothetical protein
MGLSVTYRLLSVAPEEPFAAEPDAVMILAHELPGARYRLPTAAPTGPSLSAGGGGFLGIWQSVELCADLPVRKPLDQGATRPPDVALPNRRFRARVDSRRPLKMHDHADVRKFDSVHSASANAPSMTGRRGGSATPRMQINLECGCGRASGLRHFRGPRDRTRHSNATLLAEGVGFELRPEPSRACRLVPLRPH